MFTCHFDIFVSFTLAPDGSVVYVVAADFAAGRAASGALDRKVKLWNLANLECIGTLEGHSKGVGALCADFSGFRGIVVSGSTDRTLRVWDADGLECLGSLSGHARGVCCLHTDFRKLRAASGSSDGLVKVWDLKQMSCVATIDAHQQGLTSVRVRVIDFSVSFAFVSL